MGTRLSGRIRHLATFHHPTQNRIGHLRLDLFGGAKVGPPAVLHEAHQQSRMQGKGLTYHDHLRIRSPRISQQVQGQTFLPVRRLALRLLCHRILRARRPLQCDQEQQKGRVKLKTDAHVEILNLDANCLRDREPPRKRTDLPRPKALEHPAE